MLRIDAHQHFWKFNAVRDSWIGEDMKVIRRNFLPDEFLPLLQRNGFDGSVVVQCDQSPQENEFLLQLADTNEFIKGVVGWVNLQSNNIEEQLQKLSLHKKLKGFRHILQAERDPAYMMRPLFLRGINHLRRYNFTYDILIFPGQLSTAKQMVEAFPAQRFVIDHLSKPFIRDRKIDVWKKDIVALAKHQNVSCKISGMVTEADWKLWEKEDFAPYLDIVFEAFGSNRVLFGSDWPVCLVAASYQKMLGIVQDYVKDLSPDEQSAFWGGNAVSFYNLI